MTVEKRAQAEPYYLMIVHDDDFERHTTSRNMILVVRDA
jgi:hypothetical protein